MVMPKPQSLMALSVTTASVHSRVGESFHKGTTQFKNFSVDTLTWRLVVATPAVALLVAKSC
jgi:Na+/citrate or Na+/malate symporter